MQFTGLDFVINDEQRTEKLGTVFRRDMRASILRHIEDSPLPRSDAKDGFHRTITIGAIA